MKNSTEPPVWGIYLYYAFILTAWLIGAAIITFIMLMAADYLINYQAYEKLYYREKGFFNRKLGSRINWYYAAIIYVINFAGLGIYEYLKSKLNTK